MYLFRHLIAASLLILGSHAAAQTVIVKDDFSNPASGWRHQETASAEQGGFGTYADGQYQLTPLQDGMYGMAPAPRQAPSPNVRIEADLYLYASIGFGGAGIFCRAQGMENFYLFMATGEGDLVIAKVKDGRPVGLARGSVRSVLKGSVDTRLTAECNGNVLRLSATGGSRLEARDSEFTQGDSGLMISGETAAGTSALFDNFVLSDLGGATRAAAPAASARSTQAPRNARTAASPSAPPSGGSSRTPPARIASVLPALFPGQALIAAEHGDFLGYAVIGHDGRQMHLYETRSFGGAQGTNLFINFSGDSFYTTIRTSTGYDSGIASWDVQIDPQTFKGTCSRMDLYPKKLGVLTVWNAAGKLLCEVR